MRQILVDLNDYWDKHPDSSFGNILYKLVGNGRSIVEASALASITDSELHTGLHKEKNQKIFQSRHYFYKDEDEKVRWVKLFHKIMELVKMYNKSGVAIIDYKLDIQAGSMDQIGVHLELERVPFFEK